MDGMDGSIFELRHYTANRGLGDAMVNRFLKNTLSILGRFNVEVVDTWVVEDEPDQMIYMVRWPNREHMTQTWKAFSADAEWKAVKERTEVDGPLVGSIVSTVMAPAGQPKGVLGDA
jgi:hypothetical protein